MPATTSNTRKLLLVLLLVIALAAYLNLARPLKKFSSREFWSTATVATVEEVPDQALQPGNRYGSVLMWAAMSATDPQIIDALVARGADVNEHDVVFGGTPLSAAATYSATPEVIEALVRQGADVNGKVKFGLDPLMLAAQMNEHPGIAAVLLRMGADPQAQDIGGRTALAFARMAHNAAAIQEISAPR